MSVSSGDFTVSGGDFGSPSIALDDITYSIDSLRDAIESYAAASIYQYPSTSAVNVFSHVLKSSGKDIGYVIVSSDSSSNSYLYYSNNYTVNGNSVVLHYPVTCCFYNRYRPNNTSYYQYRYDVSVQGDESFYIGNGALYYTNLVPGYPDVMQYHNSPQFYWISIAALSLLTISVFGKIIRR